MCCTTDLQAKYTQAPTSTPCPGTYKYTLPPTSTQHVQTCKPSTLCHLQVHNMYRPAGQVHPGTYKYTTCTAPQTCRSSTPCHLQVHNTYCTTDLQVKYTLPPTSTQHVLNHRPTGQVHPGTYKYTTCATP